MQPDVHGESLMPGAAASAGRGLHMMAAPDRAVEDLLAAEDAWTMTRSGCGRLEKEKDNKRLHLL